MSYDVFFIPYRLAEEPIETTNPFTGEQTLKRDGAISENEVQAVREVLNLWKSKVPTIGDVNFEMPDGGITSICQHDYATGLMVEIRGAGITSAVASLLHELLSVASWAMAPVDENMYNIVNSDEKLNEMNADLREYGNAIVCESPSMLVALLNEGFEAWQEYRNKVMKQ